jgi:hypothetical protein
MPLEEWFVDCNLLDADGAIGWSELDNTVHKEKRVSMGQDPLDALGIDSLMVSRADHTLILPYGRQISEVTAPIRLRRGAGRDAFATLLERNDLFTAGSDTHERDRRTNLVLDKSEVVKRSLREILDSTGIDG